MKSGAKSFRRRTGSWLASLVVGMPLLALPLIAPGCSGDSSGTTGSQAPILSKADRKAIGKAKKNPREFARILREKATGEPDPATPAQEPLTRRRRN